ncbi:MAG: quinone-dependent dihydroorotate dehydrogenase [bacterium]|nr:quinone-dependent dihydroorotate dehydrogenase [bacterium]
MSLYPLVRPLLYNFSPEWVHDQMMALGRAIGGSRRLTRLVELIYDYEDERLFCKVGELEFPNPIGLAAGFDKDGLIVPLLEALGFGAVEIGTLTPRPQPGNPQPRLFRLAEDQAIINRMGFNNGGVEACCTRLAKQIRDERRKRPLGINLGKNKDTPNAQAAEDYCFGLERAYPWAEYFTINISSPNTQGLRDLQSEDSLLPLLKAILAQREKLAGKHGERKPVWLKVAPDLEGEQLEVICQIALQLKLDALVLTNTTLRRENLTNLNRTQAGGLSGRPLRLLSNQILDRAAVLTAGKIPLVGVGGIFEGQDVWDKLELGASMVQIYTGMIYQGPALVNQLKQDLVRRLNEQRKRQIPKRVVFN